MESMRESWTDKRLDDLNERVDRGFERGAKEVHALRVETRTEFTALREEMQGGFNALRGEMKAGFDHADQRFEHVDQRFDRIDERFEALHRLMIQFCGVLIVALIGMFASLS